MAQWIQIVCFKVQCEKAGSKTELKVIFEAILFRYPEIGNLQKSLGVTALLRFSGNTHLKRFKLAIAVLTQ